MNHELEKYPYFIYPDVVALRQGGVSGEEAELMRRRMAANIGDVPSLRLILGVDPAEFASFYPDMEKADLSTTDTIDSFLNHFGKKDLPTPEAVAAIPQAAMEQPDTSASPSAGEPESLPATENNARILIKNHNYQGALEIIMKLSLKNPEKSIYFADQIRFLRKLILIQSSQTHKRQG